MLDRLQLDERRVEAMAAGSKRSSQLPDPIGATSAEWTRPNGLRIQRVRVPLGVIGIIYESRPNVTADAGALCLKSGNAADPARRLGEPAFERGHPRVPGRRASRRPGCRRPASSWCRPTDRAAVG